MKKQTYRLINPAVRMNMLAYINNLPMDGSMEVVIQPYKKPRTSDQNSMAWAGTLADIAEQAWVCGKQFDKETWHYELKRQFLPEGNEQDFEKLVLKGYRKWLETPTGERAMVGSTTKLTTLGFSRYLDQVMAYAAQELGVQFHTKD
jgi:hypothetical protein